MLTASDVATVLGQNPYRARRQLLLQKLGFRADTEQGNFCTAWGNKHEDMALQRYNEVYGQAAVLFGLHTHPTLPWLGASPDAVTKDGILVEIKCPVSRQITPEVPHYYMAQLQVLMEVLDLPTAHFVQFRPETTWHPEELVVVSVPRSREWFAHHLPAMQSFFDEWQQLKTSMEDDAALKKQLHEEYMMSIPPSRRMQNKPKPRIPPPRVRPLFVACPRPKV